MLENEISRRTLIKVIAAGCGVVVASSLPREWVKPVIDAGLLPVHAQTTSGGTITGVFYGCPGPAPQDGVVVTVDGTSFSVLTAGGGLFTISGVPAGTYDLTMDGLYHETNVDVTAGATRDLGQVGATAC